MKERYIFLKVESSLNINVNQNTNLITRNLEIYIKYILWNLS
jgi:hypothetical protein